MMLSNLLQKMPLAAAFLLLLIIFLAIGLLSFALGLVGDAATWAADALCDIADLAVARGRKLRERLQ